MELIKLDKQGGSRPVRIKDIGREITEWDEHAYRRVISTELTPDQVEKIVTPARVYPKQKNVLAVHWHPEFIPMELIVKRIRATFPNMKQSLIIPTQHNRIMSYNGYSGVEVDCYSHGFNRKVQLLLHFSQKNLDRADVLAAMLDHTFKYRAGQLHEYIDTIINPAFEDRMQEAAGETGADQDLVEFVRIHARKLKGLIEKFYDITPEESVKNKVVRDYFDTLGEIYDRRIIDRVQVFLKAVKRIVKSHFSLRYFYRASEVIEEARGLGAGIVVPHPEQFWPILLADYDVDGYEVWNPQSREYTEFLINVVDRKNKTRCRAERPLIIFMGDDTHMGEKIKPEQYQDREKVGREIGVQPAWDDLVIRKSLITANVSRLKVIEEYKNRLA